MAIMSASTPELDGIVTGRGDTLCLERAEARRDLRGRAARRVPVRDRRQDAASFKTSVVVPDRKPSISFSGTGYVLPREGSAGLPVTTINVDKVKVRLARINERNLVPTINADKLTMNFRLRRCRRTDQPQGSLVWQGEMTISGERNRPVVTAIPLKDVLRDKGPGVYLAVVDRADAKQGDDTEPATNWVLVSNLGLTAYTGTDGMAVAVRSLSDAQAALRRHPAPLRPQQRRTRHGRRPTPTASPASAGGLAARQRRRRALRDHGLWPERRFQLSRSRPRRVRSVRPRRQRPARRPGRSMPISIPSAASIARAKPCT